MDMARPGLAIMLSLGLAIGLPERLAAQETAEGLLKKAAEFYSASDADPLAMRCARELLTEITVAHPASDLAVAILLQEPLDGVNVADIEARAGQIATELPEPEQAGADPSALSATDLGLVLAWRHPNAFVNICKNVPPEIVGDVLSGLGSKILALGFRDIAPEFWEGALDDLADATLEEIGAEAVTDHYSKKMAVWLLDRYSEATGAEVDSEALVEIASPTARLIVAAATSSGPAAPALLAGTTAYSQARGAALSSYAEDESFAVAARGLIAADAYRRASAELRAAGRADHSAEIEALAASVIDEAATSARAAFSGSDGPLAEAMLREMDEIVQLYRQADELAALTRLHALQARADEAAPGLFSLTTNNFYERYFMIGPQHAADSVRAYYTLHETLLKIFEDAPIIVPSDHARAPALAPLPSAPDPSEPDPWQGLGKIYADRHELRQKVANAADYAVLAWAGYGDPEAVALADRLGWDMLENWDAGRTLATRFGNRDTGEAVVSFRGSLSAPQIPFRRDAFDDWVQTSALGSFDPFEMTTDQLSAAADLAARVTESGQTVTFVGHSKGGRLAQIAHFATGQAAYGFNSAPLGAYELRLWPNTSRAMGPKLQRFRAPRDLLTAPAALSAIEYDDSHTVPNAAHGHGIDSLALAMLAVAELETKVENGAKPIATENGGWGPDIVWSDWPAVGTCPRTDARTCLAATGVSEPALDFAFTVEPDNWGDVRAIEFRELGRIDFARLSVNYAPYEDTVLLNGSPDILHPDVTMNARTVFSDSISQRILIANPSTYLFYPQITAHRYLPDGTQRFVLAEAIMTGARASGSMIGTAVTFLDFAPGERAPSRNPVAISEISGGNWSEITSASIQSNPSELQAALNSLGYDSGEVDGYPGPQTRAALMAFQAEQCLPATGQPDPSTIAALRAVDRFAAPCPGARPPEGISVAAPLLSGIYVDDQASCQLENLPFDRVQAAQRIVAGNNITWGQEGGCETTRTDIRDGVTLFRGTCFEGSQINEARWRFNVTSNDSFVDLGFEGSVATPRAFSRCAEDSALSRAWEKWFDDASDVTSASNLVEPRAMLEASAPGAELQQTILEGLRSEAEKIYGEPVEFIIDDLRVAEDLAFTSVRAQRPGGAPIDISATPGFRAGTLWPEPGVAEQVQAVLRRTGGRWIPVSVVTQPTEAWWLGECSDWGVLFPETCDVATAAPVPVPQAHPVDAAAGVSAGIIDLTDAPGRVIAAVLRSGGVTPENTRVTDSPVDEAEIVSLAAGYRAAPPVLRTPPLPAATNGRDTESGALTLCMQHRVTIPEDRVAFADGGRQPAVMLEQKVPFDNPFRAMCNMAHRDRIAAEEALHGTGELARFDIDGRVSNLVHLQADAAVQATLDAASETGTLRATAECRIAFRERQPGQSTRYDYRQIGTCPLDRLTLTAIDRDASVVHRIVFLADGAAFVPEGALVTEALPARVALERITTQAARAPRGFEAASTDEAAVRAIIEGLMGQPAEVLLGYRNAFPFRTEPARELAVAVFGQLPQEEIDTVAGTERGYGSFVIKSWSELNRHWFPDDPAPGLGSAVLGQIDDLRILSLGSVSGSCEWQATYRIWLADLTPFGAALSALSGRDGLTFRACFRTTRTGFDLVEQAFVD